MFNKKRGLAFEEIVGVLIFLLVMAIFGLFFYGCTVSNVKKTYEEFKFSKDEIGVIKNLDFFLKSSVDRKNYGKNVLDLVLESYLDNNYDGFDTKANNYFSQIYEDWRIVIYDSDRRLKYDSNEYNGKKPGFGYGKVIAASETKIPVLKNDQIIFLRIVLTIR